MVINRAAGPELLDTYDSERRPAARMTVEQAYTRYVQRVDSTLDDGDLAPVLDDPSIELGPRYRSPAVASAGQPGGENPDADTDDPRQAAAVPGASVPHVPIMRNGAQQSIHDVFGRRFVLLAGPEGQAWVQAAGDIAAASGVPVEAYRTGADGVLGDAEGHLEGVLGIGDRGAAVVRPDGVLAWRSSSADGDRRTVLQDVMSRLLLRP
jgi:hypothetical protein